MIKSVCKKCRYLNIHHKIGFQGGGKLITGCQKCCNKITFQLPPVKINPVDVPEVSDKLVEKLKEVEERNA